MNNTAPSSADAPALKPVRRAAAEDTPLTGSEVKARWQLEADLEALREGEANLRDYEDWLRAWQEQLDASGRPQPGPRSMSPFFGSTSPIPATNDGELREAWEKFHRARALLQAEQDQLRDERRALRDGKAELERREAELAARETHLLEREMLLAITTGPETENEKPVSAMRRFTQVPMLAARSVFKSAK